MSDSTTDRSDLDQLDPEPAAAGPGAVPQLDPDAGTDVQGDVQGEVQDDAQSADQADVQTEVESRDQDADQNGDQAGQDAEAVPDVERLENEGDIAADYLEELLDIADLDGDLDMDVEGDRAAVSIVGADLRQLVGRDGEVLEALQELTRLAVYRETGERSRLMLDVGGFRADRRARLEKLASQVVEEVKATGERRALEPMTPFERKVVHDVVAAAGATSESEGQEPRRYVVILPG